MKFFNKKSIFILALSAVFVSSISAVQAADEKTSFEGDVRIKAFVESNRKDYFDRVYDYSSPIPGYEKKQYDKSFYGTDTDLTLALKTDLNDTSFLDFKESLFVRRFNDEEPNSLGYFSSRYSEIDHNLHLTFGLAAGTYDYLQLDYINNITDVGAFDSLNYSSNKVRGLIVHDFDERTCLAFTGSYEERKYDSDSVLNYKEARGGFEVSSLLPGRSKYVEIANSSRGERFTFEKTPGAMSNRRAIDYYTTYVRNPRDDDPSAKYINRQTRGELYLRAFGEIAQRDRTRLRNDCDEILGGFESIYRTTDNMRFRLNEIYTSQDFKRESNVNFLHDGFSNYLALTLDYDCTKNFSQSLTYSNEFYKYKKAAEENNKANSVTYENFYTGKSYRASFVLGAIFRTYYTPALMMPEETERRTAFCYDYEVVKDLVLKFKAEYADLDYHDFQDDIFSNYKRKTWRLAIEKNLAQSFSFELAYQHNNEKHERHNQNDIEEKTLGVSLVGRF